MRTFSAQEKQHPPMRNRLVLGQAAYCPDCARQAGAIRQILRQPRLQAQLTVGAPDDAYEQEADRVAEAVMRMPEEALARQPLEEEEELLQPKRQGGEALTVGPDLEQALAASRSGGQPLPDGSRAFFEPRMGRDLSDVQVHTGGAAADLTRRVSARAFTLGADIYFGAGEFAPESFEGRKLLAHELTHVVQQGGASPAARPRAIRRISREGRGKRNDIEGMVPMTAIASGIPGNEYASRISVQRQEATRPRPFAPATISEAVIQPAKPKIPRPAGPSWNKKYKYALAFSLNKPAPTRSNTKASTTDAGTSALPTTFTGHAAVDEKRRAWRYQLDTVTSKGEMKIVYYTADHYPAPTPTDDSGALTNVNAGNWKTIVKDLKKNRKGVPDFWSAYRREALHENYHWKNEWQKIAKKAIRGAKKRISRLKLGWDKAATAADAETTLKPKATTIFDKAIKKARKKWMKLSDKVGSRPYRAQAPALDDLRKRVVGEAKKKKWS